MQIYCDCAMSNPGHTLHSARAGDSSTAPFCAPEPAPVLALQVSTPYRPCRVHTQTKCSAPAAMQALAALRIVAGGSTFASL